MFSALTKAVKSFVKARMGPFISVDIGTTKSRVAFFEEGGEIPKMLENKEVPRKNPPYVSATNMGKLVKHQRIINPEDTMFSTRRLLSQWFENPENEHSKDKESHRQIETGFRNPARRSNQKFENSGELVAHIIARLKSSAESHLKKPVKNVIISPPSYLLDEQFHNPITTTLAKIGIRSITFVQQPRVLSPTYFYNICDDRPIAICDFGGGKFETSIYKRCKDGNIDIQTARNSYLGGDNFDFALMNFFKESFKKQTGIDLVTDPVAMRKLREAAVDAKILLSQSTEVEIDILDLACDSSGRCYNFQAKLTRKEFEKIVNEMLMQTVSLCGKSITQANINKKDLNEVLLIGGMTEMPKIREMVGEFFGKEPSYRMDPDESVAIGALLYDEHPVDCTDSTKYY